MSLQIDKNNIRDIFENDSIKKVKVAVTDIDGVLRGKYIHIDKLKAALEGGFGFCNVIFGWDSSDVCYENSHYTGWHTGYPDALASLDINTLRKIPWENNTPFILGDFLDENSKPLEICPRQLLKKIILNLKNEGLLAKVGCEFEWFNFKENAESLKEKSFTNLNMITPGMFGYSIIRASQNSVFMNDLMDMLNQFKIPLEGLHTETGPGVYEAAIACCDPLEACDRAVLFKTASKEIATKHNYVASFMARWNDKLPGCSGHIHQSLCNDKNENIFYDSNEKNNMSSLFQSFLAGQLKCLPDLLAMYAPTVNSYKRLVEGFWAPTRANWGIDNRTCALRVLNSSQKSTRVELRVPGADINPFLAVAASLASGLYGIKHKLSLSQKNIIGSAYHQDTTNTPLSKNLYESALKFKHSEIAHELFGESFVQHFANSRIWEWEQSQKVITDWELKRYFEII